MRGWIAAAMAAAQLTALAAAPAAAEHNGPSPRPSVDLNLDVKVGRDGFRLGGQLCGPDGVWGAWLNGARRPGGVTLDGRLEEPGRAFNFKLNGEILDSLLRLWPGAETGAPRAGDTL